MVKIATRNLGALERGLRSEGLTYGIDEHGYLFSTVEVLTSSEKEHIETVVKQAIGSGGFCKIDDVTRPLTRPVGLQLKADLKEKD